MSKGWRWKSVRWRPSAGNSGHDASNAPAARNEYPLRRAIAWAALLVFVDAIWLGQGIISMFVAVCLLLVGLPRTLTRKFAHVRRQRLRNLAIYLGAVVLVVGLNALNLWIAQRRADEVVAAVKAYRADHGAYPRTLGALVPRYLEEVPRAKYTLTFHKFQYIPSENSPLLMYIGLPPFGRPVYSFARNAWSYID